MVLNVASLAAWDVVNYCVFDRGVSTFDVVTFIIMFVDGIDRSKPVSLSLIFHWFLRSLGGIIYALVAYLYQNDQVNQWKYIASLPAVFWCIGELFIDAYILQKAWTVATGKPRLRYIALAGYIPLVFVKVAVMMFRYAGPLLLFKDNNSWKNVFKYLDALTFLISAWADICCCIVIVAVPIMFQRSKNPRQRPPSKPMGILESFLMSTEVRMVICAILTTISAILILLGALGMCVLCDWGVTAQNISIQYVYCLYYLDYLFIKYQRAILADPGNATAAPNRLFPLTNAQPTGLANIGPLIGVGQVSTAISLEANPKLQAGMNSDESVVYEKSTFNESDESGHELDIIPKKRGLFRKL
ncbi:hypothetical protein HK096_002445 [Nowakowskiella sp. JEL0078]|nr:hypothetical protein HK096_002445 [Nowakowskiella sp. JEL0078]